MTIVRLDEQGIAGVVGADAARHLRFKNQGGENNFKGSRYETFFGGHQLAKLARAYVENGEDALVEWQSVGFVDDYMVRLDGVRRVAGFQLKNAQTVSWTAGDQSIQKDFELQYTVCCREGYGDIKLHLVCSSEDLTKTLTANVPGAISGYATAQYFPYNEPFAPLLFSHAWLADDFAFLSNRRNPSVIEAQEVAQVVMGAWVAKAPVARVSEVLAQAREVSPQILRTLRSDTEAVQMVSPQLRAVLDALPGFSYDVHKGFMHWSGADGSTTGVLSFDCFSEKFAGWQELIVRMHPATFEEIEGALL